MNNNNNNNNIHINTSVIVLNTNNNNPQQLKTIKQINKHHKKHHQYYNNNNNNNSNNQQKYNFKTIDCNRRILTQRKYIATKRQQKLKTINQSQQYCNNINSSNIIYNIHCQQTNNNHNNRIRLYNINKQKYNHYNNNDHRYNQSYDNKNNNDNQSKLVQRLQPIQISRTLFNDQKSINLNQSNSNSKSLKKSKSFNAAVFQMLRNYKKKLRQNIDQRTNAILNVSKNNSGHQHKNNKQIQDYQQNKSDSSRYLSTKLKSYKNKQKLYDKKVDRYFSEVSPQPKFACVSLPKKTKNKRAFMPLKQKVKRGSKNIETTKINKNNQLLILNQSFVYIAKLKPVISSQQQQFKFAKYTDKSSNKYQQPIETQNKIFFTQQLERRCIQIDQKQEQQFNCNQIKYANRNKSYKKNHCLSIRKGSVLSGWELKQENQGQNVVTQLENPINTLSQRQKI